MVLLWLSRVRLFVTPRTAARQASLSFTTSQSLLKLMFNKSVMPSNHLILCCLLLLTVSRHTTDMVVLHHRHGRSTPSNRQALAPPTRKPAQTLDQPHPQEARLCSHSLQNKSGQHRPDPALGPGDPWTCSPAGQWNLQDTMDPIPDWSGIVPSQPTLSDLKHALGPLGPAARL